MDSEATICDICLTREADGPCSRCGVPLCEAHAVAPHMRCSRCEFRVNPPPPSLRLALGQVLMTRGAEAALKEHIPLTARLLHRHSSGDFGDLDSHDWHVNEEAIGRGERVMSVYQVGDNITIWIVTEADRQTTTILLPEEY